MKRLLGILLVPRVMLGCGSSKKDASTAKDAAAKDGSTAKECQECEKPATFHVTELTDPESPLAVHLCEDCARDYLAQTPTAKDGSTAKAPDSATGE